MKCLEVKIWWILFITIVSNMAYALIAPFLPIYLLEKGISAQYQGMIFAIYSAAVIFWSPVVSTLPYPRKSIIAFGMLGMGVCFMLFALLDSMENTWVIFIYCLVLRLL